MSGKNAFKRECWLQTLRKDMLKKGKSVSSMSIPGSLINPNFLVEDILNYQK